MNDAQARNGQVYLVSAARTPIGKFGGAFAQTPATELGGAAIRAAVERAGLPEGTPIDDVLMGQVIQAGAGQAPARQAALNAGLPVDDQRDDDQPRLRLRAEVDHARRRRDPGRRRRGRRRRRHGEHEPGAVPARRRRASATGWATRARRRDRPRRPVVRDRGLPHGHARRARRDPQPRQSREDQDAFALAATRRRSPRWTRAASRPRSCR